MRIALIGPLLHRFQNNRPHLAFVPSPTECSLRPPIPPALRAPPPPPPGGEGSHGDIPWEAVPRERCRSRFPGRRGEWAPIRFFSGISPCTGPWWLSPWGVGQYVGIPGTSRLPGGNPPDSVKKGQYTPPVRVPVIGNRCTSILPDTGAGVRQNTGGRGYLLADLLRSGCHMVQYRRRSSPGCGRGWLPSWPIRRGYR